MWAPLSMWPMPPGLSRNVAKLLPLVGVKG
jgi:hypothetical protein